MALYFQLNWVGINDAYPTLVCVWKKARHDHLREHLILFTPDEYLIREATSTIYSFVSLNKQAKWYKCNFRL